jgi:hypothetical protein
MPKIGTKVLKFSEGSFNNAFIITINNGAEVFAKLPNPNAGPSQYTTASEVATRQMVCSKPPPALHITNRKSSVTYSTFPFFE